jgi:DAACS family dicarboxylate/amino acid:cation (Na+ or H+) symporter
MKLHTRMLLGVVLGTTAGIAAHAWLGVPAAEVAPTGAAPTGVAAEPTLLQQILPFTQAAGDIFLRLLFMLVLPLIFSALVLGVTGLGDLRSLGRVGLKTLAYTVVVSGIAVLIGVLLVNLLRPGDGMSDEVRARMVAGAEARSASAGGAAGGGALTVPPKAGLELVVNIVPKNPFAAAASGDMLAFMFFALLFGIGLRLTRTEAARRFEGFVQGLYDVTMTLIGMVIRLAPWGVAALLFTLTADLGVEILVQLGRYVGVVVLALAIHQFIVYSLAVKLLGGMSPLFFFRGISEAMLTAFSTASSNATLPTAIRVAEEKLRLPPQVSRFVLTIGSTANQNGTALFEGVTVLFLAQFYGVHLDLGQQVLVCLVCILGGIGTAGVPAGSIPVVAMILGMVHVPVEGIGLILGVDRFLDMCRTTLNVSGDLAAAVVVSRGEPRGEPPPPA